MISPTLKRHYKVLPTKIDMWLTPKLISEFTPNPNFSANYEDNDNDEDNENHPENEDEGNNRANKYMFKFNNGKKVLVSLW